MSDGLMSLAAKAGGRLRRPPRFCRLIVMRRELDHPVEVLPAAIDLEFVDAPEDIDELQRLLRDVPLEHRVDIVARHRAGQRCFLACHGGEVVHAAWLAFGSCYSYMLDRSFELAADEAYLHGSFTQPAFRRQGLQRACAGHRLQVMRARGFRRVVGLVDPHNRLAMRSDPKTGYLRAGVSGFVEAFGVRFYFHHDLGAFSALRRPFYWRKM